MDALGQGSHSITPVGLVFLIVMTLLTWCLQRNQAVLPLLITTCYMSVGQMLVVGGLHLPLFRIMLLVGVCRMWAKKESGGLTFTTLDKLFFWWVLTTLVAGTLAKFSVSRFINRGGIVFDAVGAYLLFRCWVRDSEELIRVVRFLAVIIVPLAIAMIVEKMTGRNYFSLLGGVAEGGEVRDGTLRCQVRLRIPSWRAHTRQRCFPCLSACGFFGGPIRRFGIIGGVSAVIATVASGSSGAVLAVMSVAAGFSLWSIRNHMRYFRWALVLALVALALVMKAPIWFLLARISEVSGAQVGTDLI